MFAALHPTVTPVRRGDPLSAMLRSVKRKVEPGDAFSFETPNSVLIAVGYIHDRYRGEHWRIVLSSPQGVTSKLLVRYSWEAVTTFLRERRVLWSTMKLHPGQGQIYGNIGIKHIVLWR